MREDRPNFCKLARTIWWLPSERRFWLASGDAKADYEFIKGHEDAIATLYPPRLLRMHCRIDRFEANGKGCRP